MKIFAIKYGESVLPQKQIFAGNTEDNPMPISFMIYLISFSNNLVLIDAGCHTMPGFTMTHFCSPVAVLERMGITRDQITDIVITHADHDHIEETMMFPNATVYIQEDEYRRGKQYLLHNSKVITFADTYILHDCLTIRRVGGHSHGSCVVELPKDGRILTFIGDACYLRSCLDLKIPTGCSNEPEMSEAFIHTYSEDPYYCLLCHESELIQKGNGWKKIFTSDEGLLI